MKHCPDCGSTKVQELLLYWENPNNGELEFSGDAELYSDRFWCIDCDQAKDELVESSEAKKRGFR